MESPTVNKFNPTGKRFVFEPKESEAGPSEYRKIFRWDPPAGYNLIAEVRGMQMVDALTMAEDYCRWLNQQYPL